MHKKGHKECMLITNKKAAKDNENMLLHKQHQVLLAFLGLLLYLCHVNRDIKMLERFSNNIDWIENLLVEIQPTGPSKYAVMLATGMSLVDLNHFLDEKEIIHSEHQMSASAMPELKAWYARKMRRYLRNALSIELGAGSVEETLFFQFCSKYKKAGHIEVNSWYDIDENLLLKDFEDRCYEFDAIFAHTKVDGDDLLHRIHRCYLFHLRLRKALPKQYIRVNKIISFILCNRYHIFTTEADANADLTTSIAIWLIKKRFNPPRLEIPYGPAS